MHPPQIFAFFGIRGAPMDAPLAGGGSVQGAAAAARVRKGTGGLRRYRGVGSLGGVRGRYAPDAKMEAAPSLVRQAVWSRSREKLGILNPDRTSSDERCEREVVTTATLGSGVLPPMV